MIFKYFFKKQKIFYKKRLVGHLYKILIIVFAMAYMQIKKDFDVTPLLKL